jgi:hypothetical protein
VEVPAVVRRVEVDGGELVVLVVRVAHEAVEVDLDDPAVGTPLSDEGDVDGGEVELVPDVLDELVPVGAEADLVAAEALGVLGRARTGVAGGEGDGGGGARRPCSGDVADPPTHMRILS